MFTRFLMRDTAPPDEAKASYNTFKKVIIKRRAAGKRNPVDAYPGDLLFFMRVTQLLHGLGSLLHVKAACKPHFILSILVTF
jgi:hypothetical protein